MSKFIKQYTLVIPRWQRHTILKQNVQPVYYQRGMKLPESYRKRIKDKKYTWKKSDGADTLWNIKAKKFILKNPKAANQVKTWHVNGQKFCALHWAVKGEITDYFKKYFSGYVIQQLTPIDLKGKVVSISCEIHEVKHKDLVDIDNLWILEKWFIDTLHENGIIPDDNPNYVAEAGKKRYIWVENDEDRKLIFKINVYEQ